uniref:Ovule protein n=1 Tax=Schistosoma curassoni TaxID=6186 RepID=A0A183KS48_9TREM
LRSRSQITKTTFNSISFSGTSRRTLIRCGQPGSDNRPHTSNSTQDHCIHNQAEVHKDIANLKQGRAAGPDGLAPELVRILMSSSVTRATTSIYLSKHSNYDYWCSPLKSTKFPLQNPNDYQLD